MLNFTTTIQEVINTQTTVTTVKQFTEYNSKKKLLDSKLFNETVNNYITQLKNTFTFYVHKDNNYIVIVMYYSTSKTYGFYVMDTNTLQLAEVNSVKVGKQEILNIVNNK